MSYQIKNETMYGHSPFYVGVETGALYAETVHGTFLCIDSAGSSQQVGVIYSRTNGNYRRIDSGATLVIQVGK